MRRRNGFTLIELSIVLVIIGLLVGGVLTGRSLIRASELRSVTTDVDRFKSALLTFRQKYGMLPGDFNNATFFWGAAHATPATCKTTIGTGTQTCNGDGNGLITTITDSTTFYETFRSWQQLVNAGLIEGNFTGVATDAGYEASPGVNVPLSKLPGAGYQIFGLGYWAIGTWFPSDYKHIVVLGAKYSPSFNYAPVLAPADAYSVDLKIDDGKPAYGTVMTFISTSTYTPNCTTTDVATTATYNVANTNILCNLIFKLGF